MTTTIEVGTADLRQALTAVRVHGCTDTELPDITRIRLTIDEQFVTVTATDRFTAALAIASVWQHSGAPVEIVELLPDDIAKLLTIFKVPGKEADGDAPQYLLRLEIDSDQVTATDCSGFDIVGRRYRMPRLETADALDRVPELIRRAHERELILLDDIHDLTISGDQVARFKVAANTYNARLTLETRAGLEKHSVNVLIRCGESFLGLMLPQRQLGEDLVRAREWAEGWSARLPEIVAAATKIGG